MAIMDISPGEGLIDIMKVERPLLLSEDKIWQAYSFSLNYEDFVSTC
jgi:hypothetical protein